MFQCYLVELPEVDSTQLEAKRRCAQFKGEGVWLIESGIQTAGYGRKGARWWSESAQNYYATFCVKKKGKLVPGLWSLGVAARLVQALRNLLSDPNEHVFVKWPNDVCLLKQGEVQKVGGILTEVHQEYLLCGVGINLGGRPPIEENFMLGIMKAGHLGLAKSSVVTDIRTTLYEIAKTYAFEEESLWASPVVESIASEMKRLPLQWYVLQRHGSLQSVEILEIVADTGAIHLRFGDGHVQMLVNGSLYAQKTA